MIRWPGTTKPGLVSDQLVSTIDLLPTIAAAAGVDVPENLPGINLGPVLRGMDGGSKPIREFLFGERNTDAAILHYPQRAIRDSRYKLIKTLMPGKQDPASHKYLNNGVSNFSGSPRYSELESADEQTKRIYADWLNPPEYQLFDLQVDPHEFDNLSGKESMAKIEKRLIERLERWQIETDDLLRDAELLKKLTAEVEDCLDKNRRVPKQGWRYLKYLHPAIKSK
jgi:N-sulfoglucosamine sulfohydrolase